LSQTGEVCKRNEREERPNGGSIRDKRPCPRQGKGGPSTSTGQKKVELLRRGQKRDEGTGQSRRGEDCPAANPGRGYRAGRRDLESKKSPANIDVPKRGETRQSTEEREKRSFTSSRKGSVTRFKPSQKKAEKEIQQGCEKRENIL